MAADKAEDVAADVNILAGMGLSAEEAAASGGESPGNFLSP